MSSSSISELDQSNIIRKDNSYPDATNDLDASVSNQPRSRTRMMQEAQAEASRLASKAEAAGSRMASKAEAAGSRMAAKMRQEARALERRMEKDEAARMEEEYEGALLG